jgi:hypothetical protein
MQIKSQIIKSIKEAGFKKEISNYGVAQYLMPFNEVFSYGILISQDKNELAPHVKFGVVNHPMWELQQEIEGIREDKIPYLLFYNKCETSLETDLVSEIDGCIKYYSSNAAKVIKLSKTALINFEYPEFFISDGTYLHGFINYLSFIHELTCGGRVTLEQVDSKINTLIKQGISCNSISVFKLKLLREYLERSA